MGRKRKQNSTPIKKTATKVIGPIDNLFKLKSNLQNENSNDSATRNCSNDDEIIIINDDSNDKIIKTIDNKANLCGETETDILIELITEWIDTEDELLDEDVATINKFFLDLACENNKEKLKEIVDHFHESISKRQKHTVDWQTMYNEIIGLISPEFEELNFEFF